MCRGRYDGMFKRGRGSTNVVQGIPVVGSASLIDMSVGRDGDVFSWDGGCVGN